MILTHQTQSFRIEQKIDTFLNTVQRILRKMSRLTALAAVFPGMIVLVLIPYSLSAQEMNCDVSVNLRQISGSSLDHLSNLEQDLERYINENRWTGEQFERHERIRCRLQVVLADVDGQNQLQANTVFSLRRPVYDTMQESTTLLLNDDWTFSYQPNRSLIRDDLQYDDLTSFLDFYVYILLGFDYDTFSELGGSRWFSRAMEILEYAQSANASGWRREFGSRRGRYELISYLNSPSYRDFRSSIYRYHRHGLDLFTRDPESARDELISVLDQMRISRDRVSDDLLFDLFFDAKYTELTSLFEEAPARQRLDAYNLLRAVDPGHSSEYEKLRN